MKYVIATAIVLVLAIGVMVIGPRWAHAQGAGLPCGKTADFLKVMREKYKEEPVGSGLTPGGHMVSVFASAEGTFTIMISSPNGTSCLPAAGVEWTSSPLPKQGEPS